MRINRYLASCGVGSRRACDSLVEQGRVTLNGRTAKIGDAVDPDKDQVLLEGHPVARENLVYLLLNKPRNVLCTNHDPDGRRTIHDILPPMGERVYHAGRLDRNSEGLLMVTNDGDLANLLTHPRHSFTKEYEVTLERPLTEVEVGRVLEGVMNEGEHLGAVSCRPAGPPGGYLVELSEGRNRHIRRMFDTLGVAVRRLRRIRIGPLTLAGLGPGEWRHLRADEVERLFRLGSA